MFSNERSSQVYNLITVKNIDIMALTETKVVQGSASLVHCCPPTHEIFHLARTNAQRGGGVAFIASRKLGCRRYKHSYKFSSFELIIIELRGHEGICLLVNIYRPPNRSPATFLREFGTLLESLRSLDKDIVFIGDYNLHVNDPADMYGSRFLDLLNDTAFQNHVTVSTCTSGNTLDLVIDSYVKPTVTIREIESDLSFSDHSLILFDVCKSPYYSKTEKLIQFRKYEKYRLFIDSVLSSLNSSRPPTSSSEQTESINSTLRSYRDSIFPVIEKLILFSGSSPWYNGQCKSAKAKCRRMERNYKRRPTIENRRSYITALNDSAKTVRFAKRDFYKKFFEESRTNPRKLHAAVANILGKISEKPLPKQAAKEPLVLSNTVNTYLYEKIAGIKVGLSSAITSPLIIPIDHVTTNFDSFTDIGEITYDSIARKCRITSCDLDPIDFRKVSPNFLKSHFIRVINTTFATATFPESEKRGLIHPMLKSFDLDIEELSSYRPITNIPFIAKLIETAIYFQLSKYIFDNDILPATQSAYRPGHSTESALVAVHSDIIENLDRGKNTLAIYLDLSSAFDSVDHELLLSELTSIGVTGSALALLRSYLTDRQVQVSIRGHISEPRHLEYGVPQGSVLGPLLFSIYTRKLSTLLTNLGFQHHIYADDAQLYIAFDDTEVDKTRQKAETALLKIKNFMTRMKLQLNLSKTKYIIFSPKNKARIINEFGSLQFGDIQLQPSSEVKSLGVTFDQELTFKKHIDNVIKACNFSIHNLYVARDFLPRDVLISTVTQEVLSRIDYCNSLYSGLPKYQLYRLQKIINRCARLINRLPRHVPITPHLKALHFLPIGQRIDFKILSLTHAALITRKPKYLIEHLHESNSGRLIQPAAPGGHKFTERAFFFTAPRLHSRLPNELRSCETLFKFKKLLKTYLFRDAFDHKLESLLHYEPSSDFIIRI